jgi:hypothetical protein
MKPDPDVSGVPFNFDAIPMWLYPDVWDETKQIRLRGLWFVLLYALSLLVFLALFMFFGAIIFSRPIGPMLWFSLVIGVPGGAILGLSAWWDFTQRRKKLLLEKAQQNSEVKSQVTPTQTEE